VADYRPTQPSERKLKKTAAAQTLSLEPTVDILVEVGRRQRGQVVVGFAAETDNVIANARAKLQQKHADLIVANDVSRKDIGFDSEWNAVTLVSAEGEREIPRGTKLEIAHAVLGEALKFQATARTAKVAPLS
jgi:phosphopantothenoylcysteine decarboxylase/phosphopantothenate--cysteine ligase